MKKFDWNPVVIAGLVAVVVVLLTQERQTAQAAGNTAGAAGDIVAVTGEYGNGTSVLYVIDAKSRQLAVYRSWDGQHIELVAARKIENDLKLLSYHDRSMDGFSPQQLAKAVRENIRRMAAKEDRIGAAPKEPGTKDDKPKESK